MHTRLRSFDRVGEVGSKGAPPLANAYECRRMHNSFHLFASMLWSFVEPICDPVERTARVLINYHLVVPCPYIVPRETARVAFVLVVHVDSACITCTNSESAAQAAHPGTRGPISEARCTL